LTSLGILLSSSLSPVEGFSPTIPWPLLGRTHEDLADGKTAGHSSSNSNHGL
jgi:hypothetical protein